MSGAVPERRSLTLRWVLTCATRWPRARSSPAASLYLSGRGGLSSLGMTLKDLGGLGYRIVADPSTPLLAAHATWKKVYDDLADGFGASIKGQTDWDSIERDMLATIDIETLLAVERATVEKGQP
jgi:hypothetical protein